MPLSFDHSLPEIQYFEKAPNVIGAGRKGLLRIFGKLSRNYVDTSITPLPTNFLAGDDVCVELLLEGEWQPEDGDGVVHGLLEAAANHR